MSNIDTGGPVFPCRIPTGGLHANGEPPPTTMHFGMTLLDYFAAHVDTSDIPVSAFEALIGEFPAYGTPMQRQDWCARGEAAYKFHRAKAMLKARES